MSTAHNAIYGYRRISERRPSFLAGAFLVYDQHLHNVGCNDISQTGAGVLTNCPIAVHSQVRLAVNTRKNGLMMIEGKICWSRKTYQGWRSGIRFNRRILFEPSVIV